jgi:hypothetical protein
MIKTIGLSLSTARHTNAMTANKMLL